MEPLKLIVTEKANLLLEKQNCYTLQVPLDANRSAIKREIEKTYKVKVLQVNTLKTRITRKRKNTKKGLVKSIVKSAVKKAMVYLKKGQSLDIADKKEA